MAITDELALYTGMMWGDVLDGLAEALMDKAEEMLREGREMRALGCPLCGGKASVDAFEMRWGENAGRWYGCIGCNCGLLYTTPDYYDDEGEAKAAAVKNWNTRWAYTAGSRVVVEQMGD